MDLLTLVAAVGGASLLSIVSGAITSRIAQSLPDKLTRLTKYIATLRAKAKDLETLLEQAAIHLEDGILTKEELENLIALWKKLKKDIDSFDVEA